MNILKVKRVFRGSGKKPGTRARTGWYVNPNNPEAEGITVNSFINSNSHACKHIWSKNEVKKYFGKDFELVFEE